MASPTARSRARGQPRAPPQRLRPTRRRAGQSSAGVAGSGPAVERRCPRPGRTPGVACSTSSAPHGSAACGHASDRGGSPRPQCAAARRAARPTRTGRDDVASRDHITPPPRRVGHRRIVRLAVVAHGCEREERRQHETPPADEPLDAGRHARMITLRPVARRRCNGGCRARAAGPPHRRRRARHRVDAGLVLRERDRVADERLVEQRHRAAGRSPRRSRRAAARPSRARRAGSRTSTAAPRARCSAGRRPSPAARARGSGTSRRRARCRCRRGRTRCAFAAPGSVSSSASPSGVRPRERMVHGVPALELLVPLEHREVGHPERTASASSSISSSSRPRCEPQRAEHARDHRRLVGGEEHRRARARLRNASSSASRRGTSRSASAPRRPRRRRGRRAPSRPTASRPPRASRARRARARAARAGSAPPSALGEDLNSEPRVTSVASSISSPKRRSGLSEP